MKSKISVIVPVFNVETYLGECLDSILGQSLKEIEIICIDDGSSDSSGRILDEYAQKDDRIKVIHQSNAGLSAVRNTGIRMAEGEFIGFVDSDDTISPEFFLHLYEAAVRENADIAGGGVVSIGKKQKEKELISFRKIRRALTMSGKFKLFGVPWYNYVWNKIYRRELLLENNLFFREGRYFEDIWWTPEVLCAAEKVISVPKVWYYYRSNPASICGTTSGCAQKEKDLTEAKDFLADFMRQKHIMPAGKFDVMVQYRLLGLPVMKIVQNRCGKKIYLLGIRIADVKYRYDEWYERMRS